MCVMGEEWLDADNKWREMKVRWRRKYGEESANMRRREEERSNLAPKDNTDIRLQDDIIRSSSSPSAVSVSSPQSELPFPISSSFPLTALVTICWSCAAGTADYCVYYPLTQLHSFVSIKTLSQVLKPYAPHFKLAWNIICFSLSLWGTHRTLLNDTSGNQLIKWG